MQVVEVQEKIVPILREHGVQYAAVFGSVSRENDAPGSDVDIMVRLGKPTGLLGYIRLKREIENRLGRTVDLVTETSVNRFIRPYITSDLKIIYEG